MSRKFLLFTLDKCVNEKLRDDYDAEYVRCVIETEKQNENNFKSKYAECS